MSTPQSALMIVFGAVALLGGYYLFRSMLSLWGFLLGGWLTFTFAPTLIPAAQSGLGLAGAFVVGGIIGALIATPLYFVTVFLSGAALGGLAGVMVGAVIDVGGFSSIRQITTFTQMAFPPIPSTSTQYLVMVVAGLLLGIAAINFQKFMIIASSSFLGAAALVSGLVEPITQVAAAGTSRAALMILAWFVIAVIGMIIQFRSSGDV